MDVVGLVVVGLDVVGLVIGLDVVVGLDVVGLVVGLDVHDLSTVTLTPITKMSWHASYDPIRSDQKGYGSSAATYHLPRHC